MHDDILLKPKSVIGITRGSQKTSALPMQDAEQGHVFGAIADACPNKQLIPRMKEAKTTKKGSVRFTRANVSQNSLVLDSGATVHLISNPEMVQNYTTRPIPLLYTAEANPGSTPRPENYVMI